jgi:Ca-activated chloride channel family protein
MPAEFHFLRPEWLWAIPAVIATAVLLARRQLGPGSWQRVVDPALAPHVLSGSAYRKSDLRWWLLGITGVIGVLSLAGPAWQRIEQPVFRSDQALVVALDLSRSMDAQDVTPSRMLRARLKILDILDRRASGQTALVVYSSNAFTVTPLTSDTDTIAALVNSLSTDIMPSRGSYPAAAVYKGRQLLEQAGAAFGEVLLITDGGSSPATERAARDLRDAGYTLSVLGVGTKEGAPIPKLSGGFVTDQAGRIAVARLDGWRARSVREKRATIRWQRISGGKRDRGSRCCCCRSARWLSGVAGSSCSRSRCCRSASPRRHHFGMTSGSTRTSRRSANSRRVMRRMRQACLKIRSGVP